MTDRHLRVVTPTPPLGSPWRCQWGACDSLPTQLVERAGEERVYCDEHADLDARLRPPAEGPVVIDPPLLRIIDNWQDGWNARSMQADEDCADTAAREYERGFHDGAMVPSFRTACVALTLAFIAGVVITAWIVA